MKKLPLEYCKVIKTYLPTYLRDSSGTSDICDSCDSSDSSDSSDKNVMTKMLWLKLCDLNSATEILWLKFCD